MSSKTARAALTPLRQRSQYSCMAASMAMCLQAIGIQCDEDEVNDVMGARPMKGAAWEQALACAQHYGAIATLRVPSTVRQLKEWTDKGVAVMIAWNPHGREWSHASVVFDVQENDDGSLKVFVADPNCPDPEQTVVELTASDFYSKWFEAWPKYLVRRPALAIEREISSSGRQMKASTKTAAWKSVAYDDPNHQYKQWDSIQWGYNGREHRVYLSAYNDFTGDEAEETLFQGVSGQKALAEYTYGTSKRQGEKAAKDFARLFPRARLGAEETLMQGKADPEVIADRYLSRSSGSRSPNQVGTSRLLTRQGLTPVDMMFGEALPHRRPLVMQGEGLQDRRGKIWLFVGMDGEGQAILAKNERELSQQKEQLTRDRLHTAKAKSKTHEVREKKDPNAPLKGKPRKQRSEPARDLAEGRVNIRPGPHLNKGQRGTGEKGSGKGQRHPKHKGRPSVHASADAVTDRYLARLACEDESCSCGCGAPVQYPSDTPGLAGASLANPSQIAARYLSRGESNV